VVTTSDTATHVDAAGWLHLIETLRRVQDLLAGAAPSAETATAVRVGLADVGALLARCQVDEAHQRSGRLPNAAGRGQALAPPLVIDACDSHRLSGRVTFGRHYLGSGGAAHGGAVGLLFDEALGAFVSAAGLGPARTAQLDISYRALTPIDRELHVEVHLEAHTRRKIALTARLADGQTLCAEATSLFLTPRPEL
jgi:acyl-coenzyme A thioesterase PaaI-like protein